MDFPSSVIDLTLSDQSEVDDSVNLDDEGIAENVTVASIQRKKNFDRKKKHASIIGRAANGMFVIASCVGCEPRS